MEANKLLEEIYYCLNGTSIPRNEVPFDFIELKNNDIIENHSKTAQLMYFEEFWGYRLVTNDYSRFLSLKQLQQTWRKI
jgi:hypothetical protein